MPLVFWRCWLGGRKGIQSVKNWAVGYWRGWSEVQTSIWPSGCHCHSLSLASVKSRFFTFLIPAHPGSPGQLPLNGCVCVFSSPAVSCGLLQSRVVFRHLHALCTDVLSRRAGVPGWRLHEQQRRQRWWHAGPGRLTATVGAGVPPLRAPRLWHAALRLPRRRPPAAVRCCLRPAAGASQARVPRDDRRRLRTGCRGRQPPTVRSVRPTQPAQVTHYMSIVDWPAEVSSPLSPGEVCACPSIHSVTCAIKFYLLTYLQHNCHFVGITRHNVHGLCLINGQRFMVLFK